VDPAAKQARLAELLAQRIAQRGAGATTPTVFHTVRWVAECGSTNTLLADEARAGLPETGLLAASVLVADRQTAGRGRLGRSWEAPIGTALTMSIRLPLPGTGHELAGLVPLMVGCAARSTVLSLGVDPSRVELKWPNDLMDPFTGRKLAGILCEAVPVGAGKPLVPSRLDVIIGVGVNLKRPQHVDGVVAERAQWVDQIGATEVSTVEAAAVLTDEVAQSVQELAVSRDAALSRIRSVCATIGRTVRVEQHTGVLVGSAVGIAADGSLLVQERGAGEAVSVHAGDVVHLR
jgi:BirA family transcriptional regulator, biotin operon repressor / biotin---[acetyl-CoA-carboxylase] ligase